MSLNGILGLQGVIPLAAAPELASTGGFTDLLALQGVTPLSVVTRVTGGLYDILALQGVTPLSGVTGVTGVTGGLYDILALQGVTPLSTPIAATPIAGAVSWMQLSGVWVNSAPIYIPPTTTPSIPEIVKSVSGTSQQAKIILQNLQLPKKDTNIYKQLFLEDEELISIVALLLQNGDL